jgi:serine/threonine protein kinase
MLTTDVENIRDEITVYKMAIHQGVVRLLDYFENAKHFYLVFERQRDEGECSKPEEKDGNASFVQEQPKYQPISLNDFVLEHERMPRKDFMAIDSRLKQIALQVAQTLDFLHAYGIILKHFDTNNIVLTNKTDEGVPRFVDLCDAEVIGPDQLTTGTHGDVHFRAPEVLSLSPYSQKVDSWSFGVTLFYMFTLQFPFNVLGSKPISDIAHDELVEKEVEQKILNTEPDYTLITKRGYPAIIIDLI